VVERFQSVAVFVVLLAALVVAFDSGGPRSSADAGPGHLPTYGTIRAEPDVWPNSAGRVLHRPRMLVVAHRGASLDAPENTLDAVRIAAEQGADLVEVDVRQTRDGVLVVMHDSTVKRTTNAKSVFKKRRSWQVRNFTYRDLRRLDAGSGFDRGYPTVRVPTLEQVLDVLDGTGTGLLLEVKSPEKYPKIGRRIAELLDDRREWLRPGRLVVASIDWDFVKAYKNQNFGVMVGVIGRPDYRSLPKVARFADMVNPEFSTVDERYVRRVRELGMTTYGWTVDDRTDMRRLRRIGADGVVTNRPAMVVACLYTPRGVVA
jgi:glycerophosphoryl diester phosphodiesterase